MGMATTSTSQYVVGTLVVDIFDVMTKQLLFRGQASETVNKNAEKLIEENTILTAGRPPLFKDFFDENLRMIVSAPASTGNASTSSHTVTRIDHTNSGMRCMVMPGARMLKIVVMKLIAPRIELAPARWIEKMAKFMAGPV